MGKSAARPVATVAAILGLVLVSPGLALADTTATGPEGQSLTVSKSEGLAAAGEKVTITGKGFKETKGIYVAFCVDNGPGKQPTPCGGGADMSGASGSSSWISSNPPPYGKDLAKPYQPGGVFSVELTISAKIGLESNVVDCQVTKCVLGTRADHTRTADRTQDVQVPITFGKPAAADTAAPPAATTPGWVLPAAIGGGALVVVVAAGLLISRRRSRTAGE